MKKIAILALAAIGAGAHAQLWNQSALVNVAGGGTGAIAGADLSQLEGTSTLFGFGAQLNSTPTNNIVADDFVVGAGGWNVTGLTFWAYQTGATAPSITGVNFAIDNTAPQTVVSSSGVFAVNFTNIYRVQAGDTAGSTRRLQRVDITGLNLNLAAGTHWLSFQFTGTGASGPWAPTMPTSNATFGQNAQQSLNGGAFAAGLDAGSGLGQDLAFQVHGTEAVPEPMTMLVLAGAAAVAARRRKSSK